MGQLGFGFHRAARAEEAHVAEDELFLDAEPHELFVGARRLDSYLSESGLGWVVRLAALLKELDYSLFTSAYQPTGRRALHLRVMLGLVVYGFSTGSGRCASWRSWRGAMWAPGGFVAAISPTTARSASSSSCTPRF